MQLSLGGRIIAPRPSVRPSVCPSSAFDFLNSSLFYLVNSVPIIPLIHLFLDTSRHQTLRHASTSIFHSRLKTHLLRVSKRPQVVLPLSSACGVRTRLSCSYTAQYEYILPQDVHPAAVRPSVCP